MRIRRLSSVMHLVAPPVPSLLFVGGDEALWGRARRDLSTARMANPLVVASSCSEALALMRGDADRELSAPYVVLLWEGTARALEFVRELRADYELHDTVVFVVASAPERPAAPFHRSNVAGFLPRGLDGDWATLLRDYLQVVTLPEPLDCELVVHGTDTATSR